MPRIHVNLQAHGERVGKKRVARLMREDGIQGASRRRKAVQTTRWRERPAGPDHMQSHQIRN